MATCFETETGCSVSPGWAISKGSDTFATVQLVCNSLRLSQSHVFLYGVARVHVYLHINMQPCIKQRVHGMQMASNLLFSGVFAPANHLSPRNHRWYLGVAAVAWLIEFPIANGPPSCGLARPQIIKSANSGEAHASRVVIVGFPELLTQNWLASDGWDGRGYPHPFFWMANSVASVHHELASTPRQFILSSMWLE